MHEPSMLTNIFSSEAMPIEKENEKIFILTRIIDNEGIIIEEEIFETIIKER